MSAETTNVEKQARRHRPALWAISIALVAAAVFAVIFTSQADEDELGNEPAPETTTTIGN